MIVCLCEGVNDREIRQGIESGCSNVREIGERLGAGAHCGQCRRQLRGLLREQASKPEFWSRGEAR